jgi:transcriptional repressor NrdR
VDSREASEGAAIRRRRLCPACARRFTTYERREEFAPRVIKRDGRREEFRRQKVLEGLQRACEKRAVSQEELDRFVDALLLKIQDNADGSGKPLDRGAGDELPEGAVPGGLCPLREVIAGSRT